MKRIYITRSALIGLAMAFALTFVSAATAYAATSVPTEVTLGKSAILTLPAPVQRVSIADPEVADVIVITPTEVQLNGLKVGSTTLIVWDKAGERTFFDLQVHIDLEALKEQIAEVAPGDEIRYKLINPSTLVVSGNVSTEERRVKIRNMLLGFGKDITETDLYILQGGVVREVRGGEGGDTGFKFVLLLEVDAPYQVLLQITVASIDRAATRDLGFNWSYASEYVTIDSAVSSLTSGITSVSGLIEGSSGTAISRGVKGANFSVVDWRNGTAYLLKALAKKDLAKILAEPNLLVKSGSTGSLVAGGEFPIPVAQGSFGGGATSAISIEYKEFGVKMNFSPLVRENGMIQLGMGRPHSTAITTGATQSMTVPGIEVSSIDPANSISVEGFDIPAIKKDSVSTSVDLRDGETFIIAGLIKEEWSKGLSKLPWIGDIPILGMFFRDQNLHKSERELVFLVTPKIMKPMKPGERVELPGSAEPTERQLDDLRWMPLLPTSRSIDPEQLK